LLVGSSRALLFNLIGSAHAFCVDQFRAPPKQRNFVAVVVVPALRFGGSNLHSPFVHHKVAKKMLGIYLLRIVENSLSFF
jgi:hypothetical protein